MKSQETLKDVKKVAKSVKKTVREAKRKCQELLWNMEYDTSCGQEQMDANEVIKITQVLTCAEKVFSAF